MEKSRRKKYYKLWFMVTGILFLLTAAIIIFCTVVAAKMKKQEEKKDERKVAVADFNTEDELLSNYLNSRLSPIDINYTDRLFSIRLLGYISDEHSITFYYDVIFDEDYAYTPNYKENEHWDCGVSVKSEGEKLFTYGHCLGQEENIFHFFVAACSGENLRDKTISFAIDKIRLVRNSGVNTEMQTYFTYPFCNGDLYGGTNSFAVDEYVDFGYYGQGDLKQLTVSPYGIAFEWENHSEKREKERFSSSCVVTDTEGNRVNVIFKSPDYIYFEKPIQTSMLAGIEMGKFEYDFRKEEENGESP